MDIRDNHNTSQWSKSQCFPPQSDCLKHEHIQLGAPVAWEIDIHGSQVTAFQTKVEVQAFPGSFSLLWKPSFVCFVLFSSSAQDVFIYLDTVVIMIFISVS